MASRFVEGPAQRHVPRPLRDAVLPCLAVPSWSLRVPSWLCGNGATSRPCAPYASWQRSTFSIAKPGLVWPVSCASFRALKLRKHPWFRPPAKGFTGRCRRHAGALHQDDLILGAGSRRALDAVGSSTHPRVAGSASRPRGRQSGAAFLGVCRQRAVKIVAGGLSGDCPGAPNHLGETWVRHANPTR